MNAQTETAAPAAPKAKTREVQVVDTTDGRKVEFVGKAKVYKDSLLRLPDGTYKLLDEATNEELAAASPSDVALRMDFRHGGTRTYHANPALALKMIAHGMSQKYGDELAGGVKKENGEVSEDLDDWMFETDSLHDQITKGEWSRARGGGGGGISVLIQALMEFTGRTSDEVRAHIKDWTPAQKQQLRIDPEIKPYVDRIEAEKAKNAAHVDTGALKDSLRSLGTASA